MDTDIKVAIIGTIGTIIVSIIAGLFPYIISRINKAEKRIDELFFYTMSVPMYKNLKKLADGNFDHYRKPSGSGLERELYHLRDMGFIEITDKSGGSIRNIPQEGTNLQPYIKVTDVGKQFVIGRSKLENKQL